jgi:hypothetical protein
VRVNVESGVVLDRGGALGIQHGRGHGHVDEAAVDGHQGLVDARVQEQAETAEGDVRHVAQVHGGHEARVLVRARVPVPGDAESLHDHVVHEPHAQVDARRSDQGSSQLMIQHDRPVPVVKSHARRSDEVSKQLHHKVVNVARAR